MSARERVVVGRKTPGDGKLEISRAFADALGGDGTRLEVRLRGREESGTVSILACTCAKAGASGMHEHHFVQCDAFRSFVLGTELRLTADIARLEVVLG